MVSGVWLTLDKKIVSQFTDFIWEHTK